MHTTRYLLLAAAGCMFGSLLIISASSNAMGDEKPAAIQIAEVQHEGDVDFEKELLPIFRRKCLACHNKTDAESDLVLEAPAAILKGGSLGPAVTAGNAAESLLLKVAAHQMEPIMPPAGNDVGARPLTPEELGLLKLWIDQGAKGEVRSATETLAWQPLPPGVHPVYAVAISPDGQYVAASRANQIFLYHIPTKRELGRLTDPALLSSGLYDKPGVADLDLIQSLRFSPDSELLVSGGYRTVKFWSRPRNARKAELAGLDSPPRSLAISPDGQRAALGEEGGLIRLYDLADGKLTHTLAGHAGQVSGLAFSTDNVQLLSGGHDKTFRVWNAADGQSLATVETPAPVNAVAIVADNTLVATAGADNIIRLWAMPTPDQAAPMPVKELQGHSGPVTSLAPMPTSPNQLVSGSQDATLRIWDVMSGNQIRQMNHGGPITAVAVRPDGQRFASASTNNTAKLWNAEGQQVAELKGDFRSLIHVEDAQRLVAVAKREIDATKGDLKAATDLKDSEEKNAQSAEEARKKAEEEHTKKVEEAKKPIADKEAGEKAVADGKAAQAKAEADMKAADEALANAGEMITRGQTDLSAAEKYVADSTAAAQTVGELLAESLKKVQETAQAQPDNKALSDLAAGLAKAITEATTGQKQAAEAARTAAQKAIADGEAAKKAAEEAKKAAAEALAKAQNDTKQAEANLTKLAEAAQKAIDASNAAERALQSAARTAERAQEAAKKAAEAIPPTEATVKTAEEKAQQQEERLKQVQQAAAETEKPYYAVAFARDGRTLATGGEGTTIRTWDSETGAAIDTYSGHAAAVTALAYAGSGDLLSAAADRSAILWNSDPQWQLVRTIGSPDSDEQFVDRVTALDFSPDGTRLATGGGEPSRSGELKLWNVADGTLVREIPEAHSDVIYGLEFSPDGKQIASCGSDRFAKIFDVETGQFVRAFEGHTHHVLGVTWRCDGRMLATSGADNVIKVWNVRTGDQTRTITGFNKEVTAVRFVAEGDNVLASSGDKSVQMKNASNGNNVRSYGGAADFVYSVSLSANGKILAAGGQDGVLRLWKEDGNAIATFDLPQ